MHFTSLPTAARAAAAAARDAASTGAAASHWSGLQTAIVTAIAVLSVIGVALFARTVSHLARVVRLGKPDSTRGGQLPARAYSLFAESLGHARLGRWPLIGAMHWLVFVGFGALFFTLLTAYGQLFDPSFALPLIGHWVVYEWVTEVIGWLTLVAILGLMAVRQARHPRRYASSQGRRSRFFGSSFWQAYYVELTILAVALCVLALRGLEYAHAAALGAGTRDGRTTRPRPGSAGPSPGRPRRGWATPSSPWPPPRSSSRWRGSSPSRCNPPWGSPGTASSPSSTSGSSGTPAQAGPRAHPEPGRAAADPGRRRAARLRGASRSSTRTPRSASARSRTSPGRACSTSPPAPSAGAASRSAPPGTPTSRCPRSCSSLALRDHAHGKAPWLHGRRRGAERRRAGRRPEQRRGRAHPGRPRSSTDGRCSAGGRDRPGRAVVVHHLRGLRGAVPGGHRARRPHRRHAPLPGAHRVGLPQRAGRAVQEPRAQRQPVGDERRGHGWTGRRACPSRCRRSGTDVEDLGARRLPVLGRLRRRSGGPRAEDHPGRRRTAAPGRGVVRGARRRRVVHRRPGPAGGQRVPLPDAGAGRTSRRSTRPARPRSSSPARTASTRWRTSTPSSAATTRSCTTPSC